jgi:hypothetical protein
MPAKTHSATKFDHATTDVIKAIKATTSPATLASVVKAAIHVRDTLLDHEVDELDLKLDRIADAAARKRAKALCDRILKLDDRKAVASIVRIAVKARAAANKKKSN